MKVIVEMSEDEAHEFFAWRKRRQAAQALVPPIDDPAPFVDMPIETCQELTHRTRAALLKGGFTMISQAYRADESLLKQVGFGRASLRELREFCASLPKAPTASA